MTREEFQTERTRIISEMLDNPDEYGIYPTTKCFEQLDALFDSLSLPPAEGAEIDDMMFTISEDGINPLNEQPTAEGAEELQKLMTDISEWSNKTFGDGQRNPAIVYHLKKEVNELIAVFEGNPRNAHRQLWFEYADCLMLLLDSALHAGFTARDLIDATREKLEINKTRKWGKPDENGVIEHVEQPQPTAEGAEHKPKKKLSAHSFWSWYSRDYKTFMVTSTNEIHFDIEDLWRFMDAYAAQQQPTAEGAEENVIYHNLTQPFRQILQSVALHGYDVVFAERDCVKCATEFATLHAQKLAEKMVSERLRAMTERCKKLEFMIEKGLGWDDMKNDITMPHEL